MSTLPHGQAWDPELYDRNHGFVTHFGIDLLPLLDPQPGERILDLGCGTGHLTAQIAESGADVIGLDSSPEMVAGARAAYPDLSFQPGDAANFSFATPFDAIFSNAALHWIPTPEAVIACVWRALKPGGRFVAEFGGKGNAATLISGLFGALRAFDQPVPKRLPWYFPSPAEYATLLEVQGFRVAHLAYFERTAPLDGPGAIGNFLHVFTPEYLEYVPAEEQADFIAAVEDRLRPVLYRDGEWWMDYMRLHVLAIRPG